MTRKHAFGELELSILKIAETSGRVTVNDVLEQQKNYILKYPEPDFL